MPSIIQQWIWRVVIIILIVFAMVIFYLLNVDLQVPAAERDGTIDPATFMTENQLKQAEDYSRIRYIIYFLKLPYEWIVYASILIFRLSARFQRWVEQVFRWSFIRLFFFLLLFTLATTIVFLPLDVLGFYLGHKYGISTQSLHSWVQDLIKSYWINLAFTYITIGVLFWLIKRTKRWWLYAWMLTIPFTLFLYFIQPIVLAPMFNEFKPLQDESLKKDILALAEQANIPADQVYEVDMSSKTNAINAYVTGIGASARIVLWDTTLQKLDREEVLFVMAHEMAHYVKKHVYWIIVLNIAASFVFFWILHKVLDPILLRMGETWGIKGKHDIAIYPLILLLSSLLAFIGSPFTNWVSRSYEHSSDRYALEMTAAPEAAVRTFQKLSAEGLTHPNPPALVRFMMYTHPTIVERIRFANDFNQETDTQP